MAETSGPFDPVDPENPVAPGEVLAEADWESMLQHVIDGIPNDLPTSTQLKPTLSASSARGVDIAPGRMLVRGHWYSNSAIKTITSSANTSGAARIDRAVARLNRSTNTVVATLVEGTPGSGIPPAFTDNATTTDRPIARWTIQPGATAATELADERLFLAGLMLVCTSTTRPRPSSVKQGLLGYETDTGRVIVFNGNYWSVVYEDTHDVSLAVGTPTRWENLTPGQWASRSNGFVQVEINMKRIGADLVTDNSDSSGGAFLVKLPDGLRPSRQLQLPAMLTAGISARVRYETDGDVSLNAPSATVKVGHIVRVTHVFRGA